MPHDRTLDHPVAAAHRLADQYGTPCFVWRESQLNAAVSGLEDTMRALFGPAAVAAFAVKCAPLPEVCAAIFRAALWADVAWPRELALARDSGVPPGRILYSGPYKPVPVLAQAARTGVRMLLETPRQVLDAVEVYRREPPPWQVGLRLRGPAAADSRFGLDAAETTEAIHRLGRAGIAVTTLHTHSYSGWPPSEDFWRAKVERLATAVAEVARLGGAVTHLDLGGGLPEPDDDRPDRAAYAKQAARYLEPAAQALGQLAHRTGFTPVVIVEPGRFLVQHAAVFVGRAVDVRRVGPDRLVATVDAGVSTLASLSSSSGRFDWASATPGTRADDQEVTVVGPSCMEQDRLTTFRTRTHVAEGDLFTLDRAGAYQLAHRSGFAEPPPVIVWVPDGDAPPIVRPL